MGRIFVVDLEGRTYKCKFCKTHIALADDLLSRGFHCRRGKACLFNKVVNVTFGPHEEREVAPEESQKYKEGRDRIVDGVDTEFYIDTRPSISDSEDA
ncbi:hypothetical protein HAX54_003436 [Datura stramonium]|uniref:Yippee domain-containing protein n=1 Tax=Datura stramonium TaxID=4076 RepID=A0ABS8T6J8_DATST|nr:hypothetical protein [Datura stramonium]